MNKDELTASRQAKDDAFNKFIDLAKTEKRELTDDESKQVDVLKAERSDIEIKLKDIDTAERAEVEAKELKAKEEAEADSKRTKDELESVKRDLAEANEKLTNKRENEMIENKNSLVASVREQLASPNGGTIIAQRAAADGDTTAMAEGIPQYVAPLDIHGKEPMWETMGVSRLTGLKGTINLPYQDPMIGEKLAELVSVTGDTTSPSGNLITPKRYSEQKTFTLETLNSVEDGFIDSILNDMIKACNRAITAEVYSHAFAGATTVTAADDYDKDSLDLLMAGAEVDGDGAFMSERKVFFLLKSAHIDAGSGRFIAEKVGVNGKGELYDGSSHFYSTLFTDAVNTDYIVYGDLSKIVVAEFGNGKVEVIVDKYTLAGDGQVKITVNKIADVALLNPVFTKTADLDPTTA